MEARAAGGAQAKENRKYFVACRQFVYQSLQEKLRNKIPQLSLIEKKWLILQLLCAVSQIHTRPEGKKEDNDDTYAHGAIKPENILLTSYDQVFLTDLVRYKPTYIGVENDQVPLGEYNRYFGDLCKFNSSDTANSRCYLAPERLKKYEGSDQNADANKIDSAAAGARPGLLEWDRPVQPAMDIFSTGCVIAEILSADDQPLFDLKRMCQYRKSDG